MIPTYRNSFNEAYSDAKYEELLSNLTAKAGQRPAFRISESPIFMTFKFREKLKDVAESIIDQIISCPDSELQKAIPSNCNVPNDTLKPHFLTIDFGICTDENGELVPQLIELQAFPTLYSFQKELQNSFCEVYPFLKELAPEITDEAYYQKLRDLIVGDENPENVVLLELYPHKQKTNVDFYLTKKHIGIEIVCLSEVLKERKNLFYEKDGRKIQIKRIYNRVIFDELDQIPNFKTEFDFREEVNVKWITHPNWFFKVSKFLLPKLQHQYIPKSYFLNEFPTEENLSDFVLKPLFSFAGSGVNLYPKQDEIDKIEDKENFIMQRKVNYAPLFKDPNNELSKAEIRILYIWNENEARPQLMQRLVRMTKAEMVNVDFNKKDAIWIGGSTVFFAK